MESESGAGARLGFECFPSLVAQLLRVRILFRASLCVSEDPEIHSAASETPLCLAERVFATSEDWDGSQLMF